jgi:aconitate hydratase
MLVAPAESSETVPLDKGPNIASLPLFGPLLDTLEGPVLLKVGDDISTDEIMPAGSEILPYRSNIPKISEFSFSRIDATYSERAKQRAVSFVVGGGNYGQGSSREHAALGPRYLGLRAVLAKSYARIHRQNLINFGILPLLFTEPNDWERVEQDDIIVISGVREALAKGKVLTLVNKTKNESYDLKHGLTERSLEMVLAGGLINMMRSKQGTE